MQARSGDIWLSHLRRPHIWTTLDVKASSTRRPPRNIKSIEYTSSPPLLLLLICIGDEKSHVWDILSERHLTQPNDVIDGARLQEWEGVGPF